MTWYHVVLINIVQIYLPKNFHITNMTWYHVVPINIVHIYLPKNFHITLLFYQQGDF